MEDGHYPLKPAGILVYEALAEITFSLERCDEHHSHPLLDRLLRIAKNHQVSSEQYENIRQLHQWILRIVQILSKDESKEILPSKEQIRQQLAGYLGYLKRVQNQQHPLSDEIHHLLKTTRSWWAGLFVCFESEDIPATNNNLEQFIRQLKGTYRQITGRKNWNDYILRYGRYCAFYPTDDTTVDESMLSSIAYDSFISQREPLED